jgi:hypothetical protein
MMYTVYIPRTVGRNWPDLRKRFVIRALNNDIFIAFARSMLFCMRIYTI